MGIKRISNIDVIKKNKSIVIVGAGNVGSCLINYFITNKFNLIQVIDKDKDQIKNLSIDFSDHLEDLKKDADIIIIAVSDRSILSVIQQMPPFNGIVVHTSGSCPMSDLDSPKIPRIGVLYPLQTFSVGQEVDFSKIPILIEAKNSSIREELGEFALLLSEKIYDADSTQRRKIHLAAVFANNFSNHMFFCAEQILSEANMPREILIPLIRQTSEKACQIGASKAQTGPAMRSDSDVINKHLELLNSNENLQEIYRVISNSIFQNNNSL